MPIFDFTRANHFGPTETNRDIAHFADRAIREAFKLGNRHRRNAAPFSPPYERNSPHWRAYVSGFYPDRI
jgi:hypothetical protein